MTTSTGPARAGAPWAAPSPQAADPGTAGASPASRLPLRRPPAGTRVPGTRQRARLLGGVAGGVAAHLGTSPSIVRLAVLLLTLLNGAGLLAYALLWVVVPAGDPWAEAAGAAAPPSRSRLATRLAPARTPGHGGAPAAQAGPGALPTGPALSPRLRTLAGGAALLLAAALLGAWRLGALPSALTHDSWLLPAALITGGTALAWSQAGTLTGPGRDPGALLRLAGGTALAVTGLLVRLSRDAAPGDLLAGAAIGVVLALGAGLILAPLLLRQSHELTRTRAEQARQAERADIAAHLHDSVLQTLTLIRKRAHEPEAVARLARSQERELRAWLYTDRPEEGASVSDAFTDLAGEVEDRHGASVEVVTVGDRAPDRGTEVVVAATREALSNAVRHGAPPVSLYVEVTPALTEVFVRDHGPGFDTAALAAVAPDRHGVRESIIARMERHGGTATLRRLASGTEVHLTLPAPAPQEVPT